VLKAITQQGLGGFDFGNAFDPGDSADLFANGGGHIGLQAHQAFGFQALAHQLRPG
jgi:hypothetical protein